jgi:hypothetical protein
LRKGANVPLSFDGVRLTLRLPAWQLDGFATRPVQNNPGTFDDPPQHAFAFWGIYGTHPLTTGKGKPTIDLYYLGLDRKHALFKQGAAHERRHTVGARFWARHDGWSYDTEAMYQFGEFGSARISAWRVAADNAYTFSSPLGILGSGLLRILPVGTAIRQIQTPRLSTRCSRAGRTPARAQILGPDHAIRLEPSIGLLLSEHMTLSAGWGFYWRESENDGLYGIPGNVIVPPNGVKSRYEGSRRIAQFDWQVTRHLSAHFNYTYVFNARFEEQSVHGTHLC